MARNVYCIEKDTKGNWRKVKVSGFKKPLFSSVETYSGMLPVSDCSCYISFNTTQYTILREFFPNLKGELLDIQIREKVKSQAFWADISDIKITYKKIDIKEKRVDLAIIACPFRDLNDIIDHAKINNVKIKKISHFAISIASLVGLISNEPLIALIFDEGFFQIIGAQNKIPFYHQIIPMEMDIIFDKASILQGIEMAKNSIKRIYNLDIKGYLSFGENYGVLDEIIDKNQLLNPEWRDIISVENLEDIRKHPALFGVYFIDNSFNMLPKNMITYYLIDDIVNTSYYFSIAASVFLMFFIYKLYSDNRLYRQNFNDNLSKISNSSRQLISKYPDISEKNNIENFVNMFQRYKEQQRLDHVILDIAKCLSPDVVVKSLSMNFLMQSDEKRQVTQQSGNKLYEIISKLGQPYLIDITIAKKGEYTVTMRELNEVKKRLTDIFFLQNTQIVYDEKNFEGILTCTLKSKR